MASSACQAAQYLAVIDLWLQGQQEPARMPADMDLWPQEQPEPAHSHAAEKSAVLPLPQFLL